MKADEPGADGLRLVQRPAEDLTRTADDPPVETVEQKRAREDREFRQFIVDDRARRNRSIGITR